jgi:AmmeMemoRadiSam system protein A
MHPIVRLAKETVEKFTRERKIPKKVILPEDLPAEFGTDKAGVFVSLKIGGELRGCIGTFLPVTESIVEEAIRNAIAASSEDPRFPPVDQSELDVIDYSVDVLSPPEPVEDTSALDPRRYGVIVKSGGRRGLLLPDLEGVDTVEDQLRITRMKAGIAPDEDISIERFEVKRYR